MDRRLAWIISLSVALGVPAVVLARVDLTSEGGFLFDIGEASDFSPGALSNGTTDAYDTCYRLRVGGSEYSAMGTSTLSLAGRQVELPAQVMGGLSVRRLIYVPTTGGDYARYLEVIENTSTAPVSTMVEVYGNLGSDSGTMLTGTSSGDMVVDLTDSWFASDDSDMSGDPSLAHIFSGSSPSVSVTSVSLMRDNLSYLWDVTIPAGGRVVVMHFAVQARDRAASMTEARRLVEVPDDALAGADDYLDEVINFGVAVAGAPRVRLVSDFEADEGATVVVDVEIEDPEGDSFTFSWDLDDDGVFGEAPGATSYTVMAGTTDGPGAVRVGVEAVDASGNTNQRYRTVRINNVEPRITSTPPLSTSVGVDLAYQIETEDPGGAQDPPTYSLVTGPSRMAVTDAGVVQWTPGESDVTVAGETHIVEVQVDDGDEGVVTQRWELMVSPNHQPSAPIPAFPIDTIAILDEMPRFAAQNAEDVDLDPLMYTFQVDTVDTFDSPDMQEVTLPETPGFTAARFDMNLAVDRAYHWRVKANDGTIDSAWGTASFWVVSDPLLPSPDGGTDAGSASGDAGVVGFDAGGGPMTGGGCAAASGTQRTQGPLGLLALLGLLFIRRRAHHSTP